MFTYSTQKIRKNIAIATAVLSLIVFAVGPLVPKVSAAQLTARKLTLSSSSAAGSSATTTYTFDFTTGSTATIASIDATVCTTASGSCTTPTGFDNSSSTLTSTTFSGSWSVNTATAGSLRASATGASSTSSGVAKQIVFGNVQNPTTANEAFYVRITTYTGSNWSTGPTDTGVVAGSTATQISLTGTVDESLVFCVGTSITGQNCGTISGSSINFGTFSTSTPSTGTSVMAASTNGQGGYSITVNGATLTSGANTIAALATQTASSAGTSQFGLNLVANSTPSVGANVTGTGSGAATANYGTADQFRFVTGDSVGSAAAATNANTFTVSYLVNIGGAQAAGVYTATMTYICTATF